MDIVRRPRGLQAFAHATSLRFHGAVRRRSSRGLPLSRTFLADDIGATAAETETAFRTLWEAGVIEPVDYLPVPARADSFHVRVALLGDNGTKYPVPYVPQSFRPGRKDGRQPAWAE